MADREFTFDFAEGLIENNLLIVDRETGSVWSQLAGRAIAGEMEGTPLEVVPSLQTTWRFWRRLHADTRVLVVQDAEGRPYYYRNWKPGEPRPPRSAEHDTTNLGFGLALEGEAWFFPFAELERATLPLRRKVGGRQVTIRYEAEAFTAWAEGSDGELLPGILSYRDGGLSSPPERCISGAAGEGGSRPSRRPLGAAAGGSRPRSEVRPSVPTTGWQAEHAGGERYEVKIRPRNYSRRFIALARC